VYVTLITGFIFVLIPVSLLLLLFIYLFIILNSYFSCVIIVSIAQCVQQNPTNSYTHAKEGTAVVTTHMQQLLRLGTAGDTAAPAVLLHGMVLNTFRPHGVYILRNLSPQPSGWSINTP
jgi:hypothetical protein